MNRRTFFKTIAGVVAGAAAAPAIDLSALEEAYYEAAITEHLTHVSFAEMNEICAARILPGIKDSYFKSEPLLTMLKSEQALPWLGPQVQQTLLHDPRGS